MRIESVRIENFRSIESIEIDIKNDWENKCSILLGINESGKSNFLKAIALLDKSHLDKVDYSIDCNKKGENKGESIYITYGLKFDSYAYFVGKFVEKGHPKELVEKLKIKWLYRVISIDKENKKDDSFELSFEDNPVFEQYAIEDGQIQKISNIYTGEEIVTRENINQLVSPDCKLLSKVDLETFIETEFHDLFTIITPRVIFWKYDDEYLINESIDLDQFKVDQNVSIPLRNIFHIAKIENIQQRIELISSSIEKRRQLEEELTKAATDYINSVWKEHKINVKICIEGNQCSVMIEDKDDTAPKYSISQRSDGFKQFMSILLNFAAENSTEKLKNKIILLDEPEVHLHPSGVRYLRDELLKISKNNIVFVATHSIYMVDRQHLERHYKVEKNESFTTLQPIPANNPYMEEVVYEALGTSIYELIQPNMVVFEGKIDKDLFDAFTKKYARDIKPKKVGTISADGVSKMPTYTKFFDGKMVKGYFLTDSDQEGKNIKKNLVEEGIVKGGIFEINDISDLEKPATIEDLFPAEIIQDCVSELFGVSLQLDAKQAFIKQIEQRNREEKGKINDMEALKKKIVEYILSDITALNKADCKSKYSTYLTFVEGLHTKIK